VPARLLARRNFGLFINKDSLLQSGEYTLIEEGKASILRPKEPK
jgi:hypothetical protein